MKISTKTVLSVLAFSTVIALQAFVVHQQQQTNLSLQSKVDKLQRQLDVADKTNSTLLLKVESIEQSLDAKPRQLLSMN